MSHSIVEENTKCLRTGLLVARKNFLSARIGLAGNGLPGEDFLISQVSEVGLKKKQDLNSDKFYYKIFNLAIFFIVTVQPCMIRKLS